MPTATSSSEGPSKRFVFLPCAEDVATFPDRTDAQQCNNEIITAKYTWWNFIPKSIFEQFRRVANFYFLVQLILMLVGQDKSLNAFVNDLSPLGTAIALVGVIVITMLLHLKDDLVRHKKDKETNTALARRVHWAGDVRSGAEAVEVECRELAVGDVVVIRGGEEIPADVVLLASSHYSGTAHVETSNLDGETNLKLRNSVEQTHNQIKELVGPSGSSSDLPTPEVLSQILGLQGIIACEHPNKQIHTFSGEYLDQPTRISAKQSPRVARVPLNAENLLIRGTRLRACSWTIGAVVYTGRQTKAAMNSAKPPSKLSRMERVVNTFMIIAFALQLVMVIASDVLNLTWYAENIEALDMWYLNPLNETRQLALPNWLAYFFTFFVLYNNMIPISMYVMLEIANFVHAAYINEDAEMYTVKVDGKALARSANLCQELGQIEYVFSDKTGTLTCNEMVFKMASVDGVLYGSSDREFNTGLMRKACAKKANERLHDYWLVLALCHTCTVSDEDTDAAHSKEQRAAAAADRVNRGLAPAKFYDGESPDEIAFVKAASEVGYVFEGNDRSLCKVTTPYTTGTEADEYTILAMNKFDHERRCMSVVVRCPDGRIKLLLKGADSAVIPLAANAQMAAKHSKHVHFFGTQGLRTLAVAVKTLDQKEAEEWLKQHNDAASEINNRKAALSACAKQIEQGVDVLGITAIEDRLQDDVANTIATLRAASIKLWVLTGDMMLTAITIGYASKMLKQGQELLKYKYDKTQSHEENRHRLQEQLAHDTAMVREALAAGSTDIDTHPHPGSPRHQSLNGTSFALVIEGQALLVLLGTMGSQGDDTTSPASNLAFVALASQCASVIACRVSPSQKAQLVNVIRVTPLPGQKKSRPEPCTLAIGDGANDVAMIQTAHVGVGISGREGRQAVNSSDFAIHEFRFLKRLVLVHGQWNYHRVSKLILYSFYKNACFMWLQLMYSFETGFSGTAITTGLLNTLYNFATAFSIIAVSVCDREYSEEQVYATPLLYRQGILGAKLNATRMTLEQLRAIVHAALIWCMCLLLVPSAELQRVSEQRHFGTVMYATLVLAMNIRSLYMTRTWTWINHAAFLVTCIAALLILPVYAALIAVDFEWYNVFFHLMEAPVWYFSLTAVPCVLGLFDLVCTMIDNYTAWECLNPVVARDIVMEDYRPEEKWHAPSHVERERHMRLHPHLHQGQVASGYAPSTARQQRQAQILSHKSARLLKAEEKRRRSPLWQQDLHSTTWIPEHHFVRCYVIFGCLLLLVGLIAVIGSHDVGMVQVQYGGPEGSLSESARLSLFPENSFFFHAGNLDAPGGQNSNCRRASDLSLAPYPENAVVCDYNITLPVDMKAPVAVMYRLNRFWQNYQLYIDDYDSNELHGERKRTELPDCRYHVFTNGTPEEISAQDENGVYTFNGTVQVPCGLIANTMFTDEFSVQHADDGVAVVINSTGIAWESDKEKIQNSPQYPNDALPYWDQYPRATTIEYLSTRFGHIVKPREGVHNERFLNWVRPDWLSDFRKLYGHVHTDLEKDTEYTFRVVSSFNVAAYEGSKALVLSTYGSLGGDSSMFGTICIACGILAFACGLGAWCRNNFTHRHRAPGRHQRVRMPSDRVAPAPRTTPRSKRSAPGSGSDPGASDSKVQDSPLLRKVSGNSAISLRSAGTGDSPTMAIATTTGVDEDVSSESESKFKEREARQYGQFKEGKEHMEDVSSMGDMDDDAEAMGGPSPFVVGVVDGASSPKNL